MTAPDKPSIWGSSPIPVSQEDLRTQLAITQHQLAEALAAHKRTSHKAVKRLRALWREKQAAESRVSALSAEVERLRMDNETLGRALFWFAQYPEYKPNPDMMAEWLSDLAAAKPLIPPRASLNGGSDHG